MYNSEDRDVKHGGWRSWFGLENKDRDDEPRPYNYSSTMTYRTPRPSTYESPTYPERTPYSGTRGGYGYTTSDEVTRGPSWTTDRDYTTRPSYGMPTGDRDVYYRQETRTYGGDRDEWTRPTGTTRPSYYSPMDSTRDYTSRYPTSTYPTTTYPSEPWTRPTTTYPGEPWTRPTTTYPSEPWTRPTGDYPYTSRSYTPSRSYGFTGERDYPTMGRDYPTSTYPSRGYTSDYPTTYPPTRGYGVTGDRDTYPTSSYTRPSYVPTSYRY